MISRSILLFNMLSIKYQSTWKVCCRIIEIIRREMIILSSSSSKKKKEIGFPTRGCRLTLPPVLSNRGTPLPRRPTSSLSTCERASTFLFFLFKHNTPSRTFPARVSIQREREREWKASGFIEGGWSNETSLWTGTA